METRYCSKCKQDKPISEFYKNNRGGCKKCVRAYQKKYYLAHYAPPKSIPLPNGLKKCSTCQEVKSLGMFYNDKSQKDGKHHRCKICSDKLRKARGNKLPKLIQRAPYGYKKCPRCKEVKLSSDFVCRVCKDCKEEIDEKKKVKRDRKEYIKEWRKNPDYVAKQKIYRISYNQRNDVKAKNKEFNAIYRSRLGNQEKARQRTIVWRKANLERASHQSKIKHYRKKGAEGSHTLDQWLTLLSFFDCCPKCGQDRILTRDHIIPLVMGGSNYINNIQPLCRSCNSSKNTHTIDYRTDKAKDWANSQVNS